MPQIIMEVTGWTVINYGLRQIGVRTEIDDTKLAESLENKAQNVSGVK